MTERAIVARAPLIRRRRDVGGEEGHGRRAWRGSERLELGTVGVGLVHHADHVLRADHSGWPFTAEPTPFTASLLVYPIALAIVVARGRPWLRVGLAAGLFLVTQGAHVLIETPADQYGAWADAGASNLLGFASPVLGVLSAGWSVLLSALLLLSLVAFVRDAIDGDAAR